MQRYLFSACLVLDYSVLNQVHHSFIRLGWLNLRAWINYLTGINHNLTSQTSALSSYLFSPMVHFRQKSNDLGTCFILVIMPSSRMHQWSPVQTKYVNKTSGMIPLLWLNGSNVFQVKQAVVLVNLISLHTTRQLLQI